MIFRHSLILTILIFSLSAPIVTNVNINVIIKDITKETPIVLAIVEEELEIVELDAYLIPDITAVVITRSKPIEI